MTTTHKIQIEFNEATGELAFRHFTTCSLGGHDVTSHQDVAMSPETAAGLKAYLVGAIDSNREAMGGVAGVAAITHVAALAGSIKGKQLTFTGDIATKGSDVKPHE